MYKVMFRTAFLRHEHGATVSTWVETFTSDELARRAIQAFKENPLEASSYVEQQAFRLY